METINTKRLVLRTNIKILEKQLIFPKKDNNISNLVNRKKAIAEDGGFGLYLKSDPTHRIGHIAFEIKRGKFEVSYGIYLDDNRRQGYMSEALSDVCKWIFKYTDKTEIWALVVINNTPSVRVLENCEFLKYRVDEKNPNTNNWYILKKSSDRKGE